MRLTPKVGAEIIARSRAVLNRKILLADDRGVIVAGTDQAGQTVVDALRACQEGNVVRAEFGDDKLKPNSFIEIEHRPNGSCPWVFAWNGKEMTFVLELIVSPKSRITLLTKPAAGPQRQGAAATAGA